MESKLRTGIGWDAHPLKAGRCLVLGGIEIPSASGLDGWSDADVCVHAIIDALLGAASLGDIGRHFPPGDAAYKDASSLKLLEKVKDKLDDSGWRIGNIDVTIILEKPRLSDYKEPMRSRLAETLGIEPGQLSIKASTANRLGFIGREEGAAALATVLIEGK